jgi:hypothetical protein
VADTHLPDPEGARRHVLESRLLSLDIIFEGVDKHRFVDMDNKCRAEVIAKNPT